MARQRLDRALVERGLASTRQEAQDAIEQGRVLVAGAVAAKSARQVSRDDPIVLRGDPPRFVSRGGHKLAAALEHLDVDVTERAALDAGSATGGFTDCLLQAGASHVISVDVGYGQLHERLRADPRVTSLERTNVRVLTRALLGELVEERFLPSVLTADLSFTSLRPLLGVLLELVGPEGDLVLLCKPQFEVGREVASRGRGVVRDRANRRRSLEQLCAALGEAGAAIMGVVSSPILGPAGNAEFLVHASRDGAGVLDLDEQITRALDAAEAL